MIIPAHIFQGTVKIIAALLAAVGMYALVSSLFGTGITIVVAMIIGVITGKTLRRIIDPMSATTRVIVNNAWTSVADMTVANDILFDSLDTLVRKIGANGRGHALDRRDEEVEHFWSLFLLAKNYHARKIEPTSIRSAIRGVETYRAAVFVAIESLGKLVQEHHTKV